LVRRDDENRIGQGIGHVDHAKITTSLGLPKRDPRTLPAWPILQRPAEDVFDLLLNDSVPIDVWLVRFRVDVVADVHTAMLSFAAAPASESNLIHLPLYA
jgi:hypothetical protein